MITIDGKWIMEGMEKEDNNRIKSCEELTELINLLGFLPLFKNNIKGFSVEELTDKTAWWSDNREEDPWAWREIIAAEGQVAYAKLFSGKAGFVSREWYPYLATFRRDGYDFDSRYEDGLVSRKMKLIMDVLVENQTLPSNEIKRMAGFGSGGEKGFDTAMTSLQMLTYITVREFKKKRNKKNEEYGWSIALYSRSEDLFGTEQVRMAYHIEAKAAQEKIILHLLKHFTEASFDEIAKIIR